MASDTVLCPGCGITLRPFMKRCPRCGAERADAAEPKPATSELDTVVETANVSTTVQGAIALNASPAPRTIKTSIVSIDEAKRRVVLQTDAASDASYDAIFLSPPDEVRRFPLFTRAQIVLLLVGLVLLLLGLLIGYLLWSREKKDASVTRSSPQLNVPPPPAIVPAVIIPDLNASPTPTVDDQVLQEEARKALIAYNPTGFARYKFTVKDGVITVTGEADHQPEKDGATNVLRLLVGAKTIINNLVVKPENPASPTPATLPTPANTQASLNLPTALPSESKPSETAFSPDGSQATLEAQREAERLKRELEAAHQREAELQRQRDLEAQRQREAEEARQRQQQEEARRLEAERHAALAPNRAESGSLRSGTVAWSGVVDGIDEIVISGSSASVRHVNGEAVREARASFSASVPRAPASVKLLSMSGRGTIRIVQEPAAANGYTTIVRIDDGSNGGAKPYQFTLRWTTP